MIKTVIPSTTTALKKVFVDQTSLLLFFSKECAKYTKVCFINVLWEWIHLLGGNSVKDDFAFLCQWCSAVNKMNLFPMGMFFSIRVLVHLFSDGVQSKGRQLGNHKGFLPSKALADNGPSVFIPFMNQTLSSSEPDYLKFRICMFCLASLLCVCKRNWNMQDSTLTLSSAPTPNTPTHTQFL